MVKRCKDCGNRDLMHNRRLCRACWYVRYMPFYIKKGKPPLKYGNGYKGGAIKKLARYRARLLPSGVCVVCGKLAEKHHEDYARPLDIIYLCSTHHGKRHRQINRGEELDLSTL